MSKTKLLICEGAEDAALMIALQKATLIPDDIAIRYIGQGTADTGFGIKGLQAYLEGLPGTTILRGIRSIGLFVDNDMSAPDGPIARFVQNTVRAANSNADVGGRYSVPTAPHSKFTTSTIATTLILAPGDNAQGCLETLLVQILTRLYPSEMRCVESLLQCGNVHSAAPPWSASKLDKARVRAAIAILNKARPQIPLASLWEKAPAVIPINDQGFSQLAAKVSGI